MEIADIPGTSESQETEVAQQIQQVEIEQAALECAAVDQSIFNKKGIVLQFINNNVTGATSLIGGLRLRLDDIRKAPAYLERNSATIKCYAIRCLDRHIRLNQCITGAGEKLITEDYGISYSIASLSPRGMMLNPSKRQEGPLFYSQFPGLVEPIFLGSNPDGSDDYAHVVNVFIHLMPASQRRRVYLGRLVEESGPKPAPPVATASASAASAALGGKRQRSNIPGNGVEQARGSPYAAHSNNNGRRPAAQQPQDLELSRRLATMERKLQVVQAQQLPTPPLPRVLPPPEWRTDGLSPMSDDL